MLNIQFSGAQNMLRHPSVKVRKQMSCFAGNMIQVENADGAKFLVMSGSAYGSLTHDQAERLGTYNQIVVVVIPTIEKYGGGSVRCMMAELFLPQKH